MHAGPIYVAEWTKELAFYTIIVYPCNTGIYLCRIGSLKQSLLIILIKTCTCIITVMPKGVQTISDMHFVYIL